jgi:hypothetical protein
MAAIIVLKDAGRRPRGADARRKDGPRSATILMFTGVRVERREGEKAPHPALPAPNGKTGH